MEGKLPNAGTQPIRYVNSWFLGHPDPLTPLRFGQVYELGIQVSPILLVGTFTSGELEFHEQDFGDADVLDVKLALVTEDFEIMDKAAKNMILPRDINRESSIVKFKVKPIKNNQDVFITVLFYRDNNLFQEALIGARIQVTNSIAEDKVTAYFPTENRFLAPIGGHRDINIQIKGFNDFYRFTLFYDFGNDQFDVMSCTIPINRSRVADFVKGVRENLLNVVNTKATLSNKKTGMIFYEPCDAPLEEGRLPELYSIEDNICDQSLQTLAKAGRYLYVNLFYSTKGSRRERERTARIGEALRKLSNDRSLRIQVLSDDFFIPWNLFYDGAYPAEKVNPYEFWGFKHVIEEIPYRTSEEEPKDATSIEKNQLRIGMNISRTIQKELTDPQLSFVKNIGSMGKSFERSKEEEVVAALQGMTEECQLEYFYCHAGTEGESQRNFDQSYIGLTRDDEGLTLEDIKLATAGCRFKGNPIFILNACESAQMDGRFYDGFVPQFLSMGACSVVGTDCELPSLFGAHFGILLLDALLRGNPIGDILLELRRHFLKKYKNPLGMIYRVFGNADAHLSNPITIEN